MRRSNVIVALLIADAIGLGIWAGAIYVVLLFMGVM